MSATKIDGNGYYIMAKRADKEWGHALEVDVFDLNDSLLGRITFGCHPEFKDFEKYQSYNTERLIEIASKRVAQGLLSAKYQTAWAEGLTLLDRFNGTYENVKKNM
ncbi:hypothetical protein [Bacterioplanoides sp.]|uniref:hypothetical protein n=1 Tax=Bacterioplanoides sp. TaxID=2066072 RepID=UPI003B5CEECA